MQLKLKAKLTLYALFGKFVRMLLGPHAIAILVRTSQGAVFAVDPEDNGVGGILRRRGEYGVAEIERMATRIGPESRVLVVGSHVGTLVVQLAPLCREIVALEANPVTFELLRMNLGLNRISNCRALYVAAAEEDKPIEFLMNRANSGGSKRMPWRNNYLYSYDNPKKTVVPGKRIDDFLAGESYDLILMDIEGSECFALKGMPRLLGSCGTLVVEFNPHALKNVAGADSDQFCALLEPYFSTVFIPTRGQRVGRDRFREVLGEMYRTGAFDDGLVFEKAPA